METIQESTRIGNETEEGKPESVRPDSSSFFYWLTRLFLIAIFWDKKWKRPRLFQIAYD